MKVISTNEFEIDDQANRCVHEFRSGSLAVLCHKLTGPHTDHEGWQNGTLVRWSSGEYICLVCGRTNKSHASDCRVQIYINKWTKAVGE